MRPVDITTRRIRELGYRANKNDLRTSGHTENLSMPMIPIVNQATIVNEGYNEATRWITVKVDGAMLHKVSRLVFQDTVPFASLAGMSLALLPPPVTDGSAIQFNIIFPLTLPAFTRFIGIYSDAYCTPQFVLITWMGEEYTPISQPLPWG